MDAKVQQRFELPANKVSEAIKDLIQSNYDEAALGKLRSIHFGGDFNRGCVTGPHVVVEFEADLENIN